MDAFEEMSTVDQMLLAAACHASNAENSACSPSVESLKRQAADCERWASEYEILAGQLDAARIETAHHSRVSAGLQMRAELAESRISQLEALLRRVVEQPNDPASWCADIVRLAPSAAATPLRRAHSKSEYKRLTALGVECAPPETTHPNGWPRNITTAQQAEAALKKMANGELPDGYRSYCAQIMAVLVYLHSPKDESAPDNLHVAEGCEQFSSVPDGGG